MGKNVVSLKHKFHTARRAPLRATDALQSDMAGNRVEKLSISAKKRPSKNASTLNDRFQDTISSYRDELDTETDRQLAQTEQDLDRQLDKINREFDGKLQIEAEYEDKIFKPISEERLEIIGGSPEKNGQAQKQHATLADRMRDFEKTVAAEAARIDMLWKEWHAANLELVCLAIEVFGPDGVSLAYEQSDGTTAAQVNAAIDANRGYEARRTDFNDRAAGLETSLRTTAEEAINNLNEQEKAWKINEKKKIQKIKQIMMEAD